MTGRQCLPIPYDKFPTIESTVSHVMEDPIHMLAPSCLPHLGGFASLSIEDPSVSIAVFFVLGSGVQVAPGGAWLTRFLISRISESCSRGKKLVLYTLVVLCDICCFSLRCRVGEKDSGPELSHSCSSTRFEMDSSKMPPRQTQSDDWYDCSFGLGVNVSFWQEMICD